MGCSSFAQKLSLGWVIVGEITKIKTMIFTIILVALSSAFVAGTNQPTCDSHDVIFLVDESGSVSTTGWQAEMKFIQDLIKTFEVGPSQTQVAVVTWATNADHEFYLNTYGNASQILNHAGNIIQEGGGSNLHKGLDFAMKHLHPSTGNRENVPTVVIVLADGSYETAAAEAKASELKNTATVISIGVSYIPESHIQNIASYPHSDNAFHINSWIDLPGILTDVRKAVCSNNKSDCSVYGEEWISSPVTNSCYRFVNKDKNCQQASRWCATKSTSVDVPEPYPMLVRIETQAENDWIHMNSDSNGNRWIGAKTRIEPDSSVSTVWNDCINDTAHWTHYASNEGTGFHDDGREECVMMAGKNSDHAGYWFDAPARKTIQFICEIPKFEDVSCAGNETVVSTISAIVDVCMNEDNPNCSWGDQYNVNTNAPNWKRGRNGSGPVSVVSLKQYGVSDRQHPQAALTNDMQTSVTEVKPRRKVADVTVSMALEHAHQALYRISRQVETDEIKRPPRYPM
ncbi:hypothetical protein ScPMuIL_011156 [Solemya velum]